MHRLRQLMHHSATETRSQHGGLEQESSRHGKDRRDRRDGDRSSLFGGGGDGDVRAALLLRSKREWYPRTMARWKFADFELDSGAFELRHRGEPVRLEQNPFELLVLLVENRGQLVTREQIASKLWGPLYVDTDLGINTAIRKVRQALEDDSAAPQFVQTVIGRGYRFVAQVEVLTDAMASEAKVMVPDAPHERSRWLTLVLILTIALLATLGFLAIRSRNATP